MSPAPKDELASTSSSFVEDRGSSSSSPLSSQRESMVLEELKVIMQQESTTYANRFDYISYNVNNNTKNNSDRRKSVITEPLRRKISEWSFEVVDHFGFDREVVSIALNYVDRVAAIRTMQSDESLDRKEFQLIAVAALYIAIKLHGETDSSSDSYETTTTTRGKLESGAFIELSRGLLNQESLQAKELEILQMLQWQMNPPTPARIAATLLTLVPSFPGQQQQQHMTVVSATYEMASYLTELSLCVSAITLCYRPSEIAYASILCALEAVEQKVPIPYSVRVAFTTKIKAATPSLTPASVAPVCTFLHNLQQLHPDMFSVFSSDSTNTTTQQHLAEEDDLDRNTSPVCVVPHQHTCPLSSPHKQQYLYRG